MSLLSATTGSDGNFTVSGSGFSKDISENGQFSDRKEVVVWRLNDQPWINWGGSGLGDIVPVDAGGGFNVTLTSPKAQIPSGQHDLIIEKDNTESITSLRIGISGSISTRTTTGPPPNTYQYQTIVNPQTGQVYEIPEFGPVSGSIAG